MTAYTKMVEEEGKLKGLPPTARRGRRTPRAWRSSSPPTSPTRPPAEHQPAAPDVAQGGDRRAADGGRVPAHRLPPRGDDRPSHARHRRAGGALAKVNPPIRPREDVEFLWEQLLDGQDRLGGAATTPAAGTRRRWRQEAASNIWLAKSGFGGTEYLLPALVSEGRKRGPVLQPDGGADELQPGAPLRPARQGRHRGGPRRRSRARRPERDLDRAGEGLGIDSRATRRSRAWSCRRA